MITFTHLKYLSFSHSAIYVTLIVLAVLNDPAKLYFGWAHGIGWIVISLLCIDAVRRRVLPLWLAVTVVVIGGLGPFAGSAGFIYYERRLRRQETPLQRGMV
ncbi:MAG TPA: hypothetical protein VFN44_23065, partial [Solirubrobacteraceae bacterium]|nr:hypothetical protein [Solirubrobacteraceae bacterium]